MYLFAAVLDGVEIGGELTKRVIIAAIVAAVTSTFTFFAGRWWGRYKAEGLVTPEALAQWAKAPAVPVAVSLPKFRIEFGKELVPVLAAMGMPAAVSAAADFSGMTAGGEKLMISNVLHKAFVDVDEAGTEAAAATAVVMKRASAPVDRPKVFRADRPFVFLIRDNKTGATLFMGRYTGPK